MSLYFLEETLTRLIFHPINSLNLINFLHYNIIYLMFTAFNVKFFSVRVEFKHRKNNSLYFINFSGDNKLFFTIYSSSSIDNHGNC